jgi:gamma-glutamyl phosphate reductase
MNDKLSIPELATSDDISLEEKKLALKEIYDNLMEEFQCFSEQNELDFTEENLKAGIKNVHLDMLSYDDLDDEFVESLLDEL